MALSFVAQSARGAGRPPVPQREIDKATSIPERFLIRWRGEADPAHVKAIDAYWISAAEHGMNASTFTARVVASTGADVAAALSAAVGALSGPLHGGAPSRVLKMLDDVEREGDAERYVKELLDRGDRLMGFGHRVYRAEDPRARVLRRTSREIGSHRFEVAEALERAALAELQARKPDRVLATNVEFWSAVVLDHADVPADLFTSLFTCARTAGWSAHILEQKREGRLIRPSAKYVGPPARPLPGASLVADERTNGIEVDGLVREFKNGPRAVDGIDLEVAPGEIYGFLGPNGAGKSTTVLMLTTLLPPTAGTARVAGYDIVREGAAVRAAIGAALQEAALDPLLTGRDHMRLQTTLQGLPKARAARARRRADRARRARRRRRPQGRRLLGRDEAAPRPRAGARAPARGCCSSTSRRPGWTRPAAPTCGRRSRAWRATTA